MQGMWTGPQGPNQPKDMNMAQMNMGGPVMMMQMGPDGPGGGQGQPGQVLVAAPSGAPGSPVMMSVQGMPMMPQQYMQGQMPMPMLPMVQPKGQGPQMQQPGKDGVGGLKPMPSPTQRMQSSQSQQSQSQQQGGQPPQMMFPNGQMSPPPRPMGMGGPQPIQMVFQGQPGGQMFAGQQFFQAPGQPGMMYVQSPPGRGGYVMS